MKTNFCSRNAICWVALRMAGTVDGTKTGITDYPWWACRIWHGMTFGVWWALLRRHGFRISPSRVWLAVSVTLVSLGNSLLAGYARCRCRDRLRKAEPHPAPLILMGHPRSGTTLLHELLVTDPRWGYADTYQCFVPSHWLLSRKRVLRWLGRLLPSERPEDGMKVGLGLPQEDEFALLNLGAPSTYEGLAFPSDPLSPWQTMDLEKADPSLRKCWQDTFVEFLRGLAAEDPRPPVLKSPPHLTRIGPILERFPGARFVHIRRNPYHAIPSMIGLTRGLYQTQGFQPPPEDMLGEALQYYLEMFAVFDRDVPKLGPGRFHELSYEDLVADPVGELQRLYAALGLEGFDPAGPALQRRVEEMRAFRPVDRPPAPAADLDLMDACFGERARRWGYPRPRGAE